MFLTPLILPLTLALAALISAFMMRHQLIMILLSLELVMLGIFMSLMMVLNPVVISLYFLVMGAVEASIGLSLIVLMARMSGLDLMNLMSMK